MCFHEGRDRGDVRSRGGRTGVLGMVLCRKMTALFVATISTALFVAIVNAPAADAADLTLQAGDTYTARTTALTLTGPALSVTGKNIGGIAVFTFDSITIPAGAVINAMGGRPFELRARNSLTLAGTVNGDGVSATDRTPDANAGGPGGGAGGADFSQAGSGPGGGGHPSNGGQGGGGGGFGGAGAEGATCTIGCPAGTAGVGGATYGNLNARLQGGSGGSGASTTAADNTHPVGGGGGGGAIALFGKSVTIKSTGIVTANGGDGACGSFASSGAGSGGAILVHGETVQIDGSLSAAGGAGGSSGDVFTASGGGGGGGRIAVQYKTFSHASMSTDVGGGLSGGNVTTCPSAPTDSPDPRGDDGVVKFTRIDATSLTIGSSKTIASGTTITVATTLTDSRLGTKLSGQTVALYKRTSRTAPWKLVTTKVTSSVGRATVQQQPMRFTQYRWTFAGSLIYDRATSPTQTIKVQN